MPILGSLRALPLNRVPRGNAVSMKTDKRYPVHSHSDMVRIPRWEYDSLREIARLHQQLLGLVEKKLPDVHKAFKASV